LQFAFYNAIHKTNVFKSNDVFCITNAKNINVVLNNALLYYKVIRFENEMLHFTLK
jgi:hypothetical protein